MSKKALFFAVMLFLAAILCSACGSTAMDKKEYLDSGVVNQNYQGVAQPQVPKKLKLSDGELQNGVKKVPLKSSTGQQLIPEVPVIDSPGEKTDGQTSDAVKPQV